VRDGEADVVGGQRVTERRHVPTQGAHRTAFMDDGEPVRVRFARGKGAVTEVGKRRFEADHREG
jgi:hypothetical protein